jgi:hypothetical protein
VGTSKLRVGGGGDKDCTITRIGCGASGAYAPGPDDEEEKEARLKNCGMRLLALSCLSVCPSVSPHGTPRLQLDGLS